MTINQLIQEAHNTAKEKGFWDVETNVSVKLMLIVTELAEACEADRKGNKEHFTEEIADTFIRLFDLCGGLDLDIETAITKKMAKNKTRPRLHEKRY